MIALGIDPGLETIWFWIVRSDWNAFQAIDFWVIQTSSKDDFKDRLLQIQDDIISILDEYKPNIVAIERLYFWTNITNALSVAHSRGIIVVECARRWVDILEFSPNEVKSLICWYWKAEKQQIQFMIKDYLWLDKFPKPDDAADALALAICWLLTNGRW